jgi:hypothetical protein
VGIVHDDGRRRHRDLAPAIRIERVAGDGGIALVLISSCPISFAGSDFAILIPDSPSTFKPSTFKPSTFKRIFAISRRDAPELCVDLTPLKRVQGKPGARCTRGLVCNVHKKVRTRAYRSSGEHPTFPAQWFYGLYHGRPGETGSIATIAAPE